MENTFIPGNKGKLNDTTVVLPDASSGLKGI